MLMGITRIGSLIINENAFNLLFIIAWAVRTLSPVGGKEDEADAPACRGLRSSDRGACESVKHCVNFKTTFHKI